MSGYIITDLYYSIPIQGTANSLHTKPLLSSDTTTMAHDIILDFIRKSFFISGYTLFYLIAMFAAGTMGRFSGYIAEKWIMQRFIPKKLTLYRDAVQVMKEVCILICSTGYLIVALGLLFMHLVGGLPHEYDMLAAQIGIAFFGELIFVTLCLGALFVGFCAWAVWKKCRGLWREKALDEETGLMKHANRMRYGTSNDPEQRRASVTPSDEVYQQLSGRNSAPKRLDRAWVRLKGVSSVRDLDVSWNGGHP